jgi:GNAT superfamily N-acetyltransferase
MNNRLNFKVVDFTNSDEAIKVQRNIFKEEDGMINVLASLDRDLFVEITGINYPDDKIKYYLAYNGDVPVGITGLYIEDSINERWLAWFGVIPEYRNLGYGSEILNWSFSKAVDDGAKVLRLYTDAIANKHAIRLYKKFYRSCELQKFFVGG